MSENKNKNLSPQDFEFTQADEKIYDKRFETKPIGYFKDAMIRFRKNKTNVVASSILGIIVICTILIPIISTKNYTQLEAELAFLPPRIPLLAEIGILDGTSKKEGVPVDPTTVVVDPETGETSLGLPLEHGEEVIVEGTLTNYWVGCTDKDELCVRGETVLRVDSDSVGVSVESNEFLTLTKTQNSMIEVEVAQFVNNSASSLEIYIEPSFGSGYELVGSTSEAGTIVIDFFDLYPGAGGTVYTKIKLVLVSNDNSDYVAIDNVSVFNDSSEDSIFEDEGFDLSQYVIVSGAGRIDRQNGEMLVADFRFKAYVAALGEKERLIPASEFDRIMADNSVCEAETLAGDFDDRVGHTFPEGCPIVSIISFIKVLSTKNALVGCPGNPKNSLLLYLAIILGFPGLILIP